MSGNNGRAQRIISMTEPLLLDKGFLLVAIDGRCAAGKTTLAEELRLMTGCSVFHMDDFFLRPEQRTAERLLEIGGNVDYERFLSEVLLPLSNGNSVAYRPYSCSSGALGEKITVAPARLNIIEGAYCCHPALRGFYDLRFFLGIDKAAQLARLSKREGERLAMFTEKWIPLEEAYFDACPADMFDCAL